MLSLCLLLTFNYSTLYFYYYCKGICPLLLCGSFNVSKCEWLNSRESQGKAADNLFVICRRLRGGGFQRKWDHFYLCFSCFSVSVSFRVWTEYQNGLLELHKEAVPGCFWDQSKTFLHYFVVRCRFLEYLSHLFSLYILCFGLIYFMYLSLVAEIFFIQNLMKLTRNHL